MQPVEIDYVGLQILQTLVHIMHNICACHPADVHTRQSGVCALRGYDHFVAHPARCEPLANRFFADVLFAWQPICIDFGAVQKITALFMVSIEHTKRSRPIYLAANIGRAQADGGGFQNRVGNGCIVHGNAFSGSICTSN